MLTNRPGRWILPILAGLLGFAAFPKLDLGILAWIGMVPLIIFIYLTRNPAVVFLGGMIAAIIQQGALLFWTPPVLEHYGGMSVATAWASYGLLLLMLAVFPALACAAVRLALNSLGDIWLLSFPVVWVAMEYALSFVPFGGFPWLLLGYSQTRLPALIQVADAAGVYGVSFLVLCGNVAIAWFLLRKIHRRAWLGPAAAGTLLVVAAVIYGIVAMNRWQAVRPELRVAMLQANLSADEDWETLKWKFEEGYSRMAGRLPPGGIDLLVIPEAPSPVTFEQDGPYRESMIRLANGSRLGVIFNNIASEENGDERRYYNSAYFLDAGGRLLGRYDKMHLVPFGEYIPLKKFFSFAQTISKDVGDFTPGNEYRIIKIDGREVAAMICFEAVFPQIARKFVSRGSQLLINLTNDAWYGESAAPYQHLLMARWRALENRRYLLRAANSGISAVIDPLGGIQTETAVLKEAICTGRFAFIRESSFYSRHGDWFAVLCAIISGAIVLTGSALLARSRADRSCEKVVCEPPDRRN